MGRKVDIRLQLVMHSPLSSIVILRTTAIRLKEDIDTAIPRLETEDGPIIIKSMAGVYPHTVVEYQLESDNKFKLVGSKNSFTVAGLNSFVNELKYYSSKPEFRNTTFDSIIIKEHLGDSLSINHDTIARIIINAEIYTILVRRYQNRSRAGSNAAYSFRRTVTGFVDAPEVIEFTLDRIKFEHNLVHYRLRVSSEELENIIGGNRIFNIPENPGLGMIFNTVMGGNGESLEETEVPFVTPKFLGVPNVQEKVIHKPGFITRIKQAIFG